MKKKILLPILVLVLSLVLALPMAASVMAGNAGIDVVLSVSPTEVCSCDEVTIKVTAKNTGCVLLKSVYIGIHTIIGEPFAEMLAGPLTLASGEAVTVTRSTPTQVCESTTFEAGAAGNCYDGCRYQIISATDTADVEVVPRPPPVECGECDGGVTELTLKYLGTDAANIVVKAGSEVVFQGDVEPGGQFSFVGVGSDLKLGKEIKVYTNGGQETKIHTSCSRPIGPGLVVGNFEVIDGYSLKGGRLCPMPECMECKGGVTQLTLRYLGESEADVVVYEGKDPEPDKVLFSDSVNPDEEFTFTGIRSDLTMSSEISVWVDGQLHTKVHTSCSQPIGPGMISGDFEIVEAYSKDYGLICPLKVCSPNASTQLEFHDREVRWKVTNDGDLGLEISRISISWPAANGFLNEIKRDGDVIHKGDFPAPSAVIDTGWEGDANKRTIKPGETDELKFKFQNNVNPTGAYSISVEFASGCSIETEIVTQQCGETPVPCGECDGGVTELTLRYLGGSNANVIVYEGKDPKPEKILFEATIDADEQFTFTGIRSDLTMSSEISVWVDGQLHTKLHTSCSQPIGPGMISGDFEIIQGYSKNNGLMCPLKVCAPNAATQLEFHDKEVRWKVANTGDLGLEISRISISWPAANGFLDEIKRDGDTIHKGDFTAPSAVIDTGWEGDTNKRTIKPGETDELKFKFQNNVRLAGPYSISVEFASGCSIVIEIVP